MKSKTSRAAASGNDTRTVLDSIRRIVRALRVSSRAAEKNVGLSGAQVFILQQLASVDALSVNDVAARTFTHQSTVSEVVQRLVEKKLVERRQSKQDGRRAELSLTPAGAAHLRKLSGVRGAKSGDELFQHRLIAALEKIDASRRTQLAALLRELVQHAGIAGETPEMFFADERGASGASAKKRRKRSVSI